MCSSARLLFTRCTCGVKAEWQGGKHARSTLEVNFRTHPQSCAGVWPGQLHRKLAILSVRQAGELFQLLQRMRLDVHVTNELHELFVKPGVLVQLIQATHTALPFEGAGAFDHTQPKKSSTVVVYQEHREIRELDKLSMFP